MAKTVCIVQGHPHGTGKHFCHALAKAYEAGAKNVGAAVETIDLGALEVGFLRDPAEFATPPPKPIIAAQEAVTRCHHLFVIYPLWLGAMPAVVKAFFEQLSRNEFAIAESAHGWPRKMLKGRSARVAVTMGMPAAAYRLIFGAHGVKGFESGVLAMAGFKPVRETLIGGVGALKEAGAARLLKRFKDLGARDAGGRR
ncbi:MAG: NAD(P)H-dependent oxidoreductase [Amphiplicatus sp.]